MFSNLKFYDNTPDVVDDSSRQAFVLEVSCTFDHSLVEAFFTEITKYQPLADVL